MAKTLAEDGFEDRLVHYSEQLGRLVGTVHGRAQGWLDRSALAEHLTRIRDGAIDLLSHLEGEDGASPTGSNAGARQSRDATRRASLVAAPGKRHRAPVTSLRGVKHSDERISKLKAAAKKSRRGGRG